MQAAPTAAETICSALVRPGLTTLALDAEGDECGNDTETLTQPTLQHPLDTGALALLLPGTTTPYTDDGHTPTGVLEITDHLVLGADRPVRSVTWLAGYLELLAPAAQRRMAVEIAETRPHEGLLDLGHSAVLAVLWPTSAVLADTHGIDVVDPTDLCTARADPFCLMEDAWLTHMELAHGDILAGLTRRLPPELRGNRVRPLAIDSHGITLRVAESLADDSGTTDVRMPFGRTVRDPLELGRAVRTLARCPHPVEITAVR
ncbi:DUF2470 domain-containing protein [Tomitella cavernea]|uniref:DUF2470 domain-containing protein n=1 Tax=Tomitella cavernea TaxID=1387982 RepID=A0ABP9C4Q4_9ACTN|nr:DUF2470 domain-containing protein [Tomitella cavernea]